MEQQQLAEVVDDFVQLSVACFGKGSKDFLQFGPRLPAPAVYDVGGQHTVRRVQLVAVDLRQFSGGVRVELLVQRLNFIPEVVDGQVPNSVVLEIAGVVVPDCEICGWE